MFYQSKLYKYSKYKFIENKLYYFKNCYYINK